LDACRAVCLHCRSIPGLRQFQPLALIIHEDFARARGEVVNAKAQVAAREEAVAQYRQAVPTAIRDVESGLAQVRDLGEQAEAGKATDWMRASHERGAVSYLDLLDAERTRLQSELAAARVAAQRYLATVRLIKAPGGSW